MAGIPDPGNRGDDGSDPVFTQTLGVGGIAAPAAGPGVVFATADRATKLTITTPNTIFDGGGFQVTGGIDVMADGVTVQNFRINAQRQYGVYAEGKNITIQNNDIANVKVSGDKDLNAITGFGENLRVLFNTAINFVTGDPGASHTDFFQTWISSSHPTGSTGLEIRGNKATGPANPSRLHSIASIHQCVMIEGRGRGGNTGGTGDTKTIIISDNEFGDSWNQCIKLDGVQGAIITRNKFTGSSDHVIAITSASSDIKYYSDNMVDGTYGNLGVPITTGAGPDAPSGGGSLAGAPIYPAQFPDGTAFPNFTEPAGNQAVAVANASELASKLASVQPGQTLVLADGTYDIGAVTISKTGTKTQPIVIKPLNAGGVKLASETRSSSRVSTSSSWDWRRNLTTPERRSASRVRRSSAASIPATSAQRRSARRSLQPRSRCTTTAAAQRRTVSSPTARRRTSRHFCCFCGSGSGALRSVRVRPSQVKGAFGVAARGRFAPPGPASLCGPFRAGTCGQAGACPAGCAAPPNLSWRVTCR